MTRIQGFIYDCQQLITNQLGFADAWSALAQEFAAMQTNGNTPTQADLDVYFVTCVITLAQWNAALTAQQAVVDFVHAAAQAPKLYRVKK